MRHKRIIFFGLVLISLLLSVAPAFAEHPAKLSNGQTLYVPVYSHVYSGPNGQPFQLAVMLSVRNTDPRQPLTVTTLDFYNNDGHLVHRYLTTPITLGPLASHHVFIEENNQQGGFGANFIVRWQAEKAINAPLVESVMIGARSGQGISFVCPAQPLVD
ncbi:DUF3124 domain-containing protein [uncultured Desulfuromonas sp.]|uniref:DUF3124 domain-containing protein n=1 Tax=uncultured Desulfuromonas sp. TaxID=181013 RepID=UPI002AAB53CE|nr:DUF3124 domain-containing protein [uncultured Desulfuromonas sp.]